MHGVGWKYTTMLSLGLSAAVYFFNNVCSSFHSEVLAHHTGGDHSNYYLI